MGPFTLTVGRIFKNVAYAQSWLPCPSEFITFFQDLSYWRRVEQLLKQLG